MSAFHIPIVDDEVDFVPLAEIHKERFEHYLKQKNLNDSAIITPINAKHRTVESVVDEIVSLIDGCIGWGIYLDLNYNAEMTAGQQVLEVLEKQHYSLANACCFACLFTRFVDEGQISKNELENSLWYEKLTVSNRFVNNDSAWEIAVPFL